MTPKEKAQELINKYLSVEDTESKMGGNLMFKNEAITCSLIAVEEIINSSPSTPILSDAGSFVNDIEESTEWWKKVKNELEIISFEED